MLDDNELIKLSAKGEIWAFDELYRKYSSKILNFIYRMTGDRLVAEDLMQDTFVKVFENSDKFNSKYKFTTWIYKIASNLTINEINKSKLRNIKKKYWKNNSNNDEFQIKLEKKEVNDKILKCLNRLSLQHRAVLVLKFYQHCNYDEISEILNISIGTVKSRIHYAVRNIRHLLQEVIDERL